MPVMFADREMAPALEAIWREAFPEDSRESIALFFSCALRPGQCLTWIEDDRPVSMAFLLPAAMELRNERGRVLPALNLRYVYAAATLKVYRGRGIFGTLLLQAHDWARSNGADACFLRPAEPSLYSYYERFGYTPFFYTVTERLPREEFLREVPSLKDGGSFAPTPPSEAAKRRDALLDGHSAWVRWPDWLVEYAVRAVKQGDGELLADSTGFALCEKTGETLFIREWLCREDGEAALRRAADARFGANEIVRRMPAEGGRGEPFGMLCPLTEKSGNALGGLEKVYPYMGLAFD